MPCNPTTYIPLLTNLLENNWDGDPMPANTTYTLDAKDWGVPGGGVKAIEVRLVAKMPANASGVYLALQTTNGDTQVAVRGVNGYIENSGTVAVNALEKFWIDCGNQTVDEVYIEITGYYL